MKKLLILAILVLPLTLRADLAKDLANAASKGDRGRVESLLAGGADINSIVYSYDATALMLAARYGRLEMVKFLIDKGADINIKNRIGSTAIHVASEYGRIDVVKYLVKKGADVNAGNKYGYTPLMRASLSKHPGTVKYLIKKGAKVKAKAKNGFTALMSAAIRGQYNNAKILIKEGANINAMESGNDSRTALTIASENGYLDTIKVLLGSGADINALGKGGYARSALMAASSKGRIKVMEFLLSKGADLHARNTRGATAFIFADTGNTKTAEYLLGKGVDINSRTPFGLSLLIMASRDGEVKLVKYLIKKGADFNARTGSGRTARDYASEKGFNDIVKILDRAARAKEKNDIVAYFLKLPNEAVGLGNVKKRKAILKRKSFRLRKPLWGYININIRNGYLKFGRRSAEGRSEIEVALWKRSGEPDILGIQKSECGKHGCSLKSMNFFEYYNRRFTNVTRRVFPGVGPSDFLDLVSDDDMKKVITCSLPEFGLNIKCRNRKYSRINFIWDKGIFVKKGTPKNDMEKKRWEAMQRERADTDLFNGITRLRKILFAPKHGVIEFIYSYQFMFTSDAVNNNSIFVHVKRDYDLSSYIGPDIVTYTDKEKYLQVSKERSPERIKAFWKKYKYQLFHLVSRDAYRKICRDIRKYPVKVLIDLYNEPGFEKIVECAQDKLSKNYQDKDKLFSAAEECLNYVAVTTSSSASPQEVFFWVRRKIEGNQEVVFDILSEIFIHYGECN